MPGSRHPVSLHALRLVVVGSLLQAAGCATLPPPTNEIAVAQQAVTRADGADSDQYASSAVAQSRDELAQAQAALSRGRDAEARQLALAAAADADLAYATSSSATTRAEYAQQAGEIAALQKRLEMPVDPGAPSPLDEQSAPTESPTPATGDPAALLATRLRTLESDPRFGGFAAYERLLAHQALDALAAVHGRERDRAAYLADRRIAIAELAARTEATRAVMDRLSRQRSDLLVEASRRDAEQARQEAERLRLQAQVQAEEAERLREQAATDATARQQAEAVIVDVGASEVAKLKAARDKEAALARQEAALMAQGTASRPAPRPDEPTSAGSGKPSSAKAKKKRKQ